MTGLDWIAVDWGTSNLRAWAMSAENTVLAEAASGDGMGKLDRDGFEPALLALVGDWLGAVPVDVVASGMVGARQGWVEAPYRTVPCAATAEALTRVETRDTRLRVAIVPGVCQAKPADVMRGEETQIAGWLKRNPGWDGVVCLPGTHTKWALLSAGEIVAFQSFMTGEIFALLHDQSVLRHSLGEGWDGDAFHGALDDMISDPAKLAARLFSLRAEGLLADLPGDAAVSRLSGLLIGAELAAARPYWLGQQVAVIGMTSLARAYADALERQGVPVVSHNVDDVTRAGLIAARQTPGAET